MGEWIAQAPALIASIVVVFGPGLLIAGASGVRGLALWALAPAIGTTALTGSALVFGLVGVPWRPLPAAAAVVGLAAVAWVVRRALRLPPVPVRRPDGLRAILVAGLVVGALYTALRLGLYITDPTAISQTNDAAFHLSALRFAIDTGAASPLEISRVIGATSFYPSGWHVLAALVPQATGASIAVAANTVSIVLGAVVWPLGVAYLVRTLAGTLAAAVSAALAGFVPAFPLLLVQWGVLYPQLLAVSVLPAALGAVVGASSLREGRARGPAGTARLVIIVAAAVAAIAVAQPSVLLAWAVAACAFGVSAVILSRSRMSRRALVLAWVAVTAGLVATGLAWWFFSRSVSVTWPPSVGKGGALLEVVANAYLGYPPAIVVSALAIVGVVVSVLTPRLRWLVAVWLVFSGLYFTAAAIGSPVLRALLVGAWYEDPYRLAALTPVATVPLAGIGAAWLTLFVVRRVRRVRDVEGARLPEPTRGQSGAAIAVIAVVGAVTLVVAPQIDRRDVFVHRVDPNLYAVSADSFLSADELAILQQLDDFVPEDAVVLANPGTGAAFGYAVSGRNVLPRTWAPPADPAYAVLWTSLRDVASDPAVCESLDAFGARYVLDFGPGEEYPGRWIMPGFTGIDGQPGFELLDRRGDASLWRVTACD